MKHLLLAFQFLTIMPVKVSGNITEKDIADSAAFFPLVGAFQGLVTAIPAFLLMKALPDDIAAGFALLFLILSNGGFDLDGLADTVDALAVKSSGDPDRDRERRLSIMKDSAIGAMGVIALIVTILLKFILMRRFLSDLSALSAAAVFFLMPVFSKWVTVPAMRHARPARKDGLGKIFIEHAGSVGVIISTAIVIFFSLVVSLPGIIGSVIKGIELCILVIIAFYFSGLLAVKFFMKEFGGMTGDHFGAMTEISEIVFLLLSYIWLQRSIS